MHNPIFNQPLAIDKDYLQSLIISLFVGMKTNKILSAEEIEQKIKNHLELQSASAEAQGAETFPVVLNISGPIIKYSSWYYLGTQSIIRIVNRLQNDERISGIVFNIDSGGGMVSGTAELCSVIKNSKLPTIAFTNGYMCSAAYDIAAACNKRVAHPNADLIGSIGTMLSFQDYSKMFEKWGAKIYEVYAPQSTEKNAEWRALMEGNEKPYTERLQYLAQDFINRVSDNLGETLTDDSHVFKGKTYTPKEALKIGLVDDLGTLQSALEQF